MSKLRVLSLFSGIGAFEKALTNIGIDYDLVGFSEIDKYAIKSYCAIHDVDENLNLGDVTQIKSDSINTFDLLVGGSPCFIAGTKILTNKGYKNIEDIQTGDKVLTHTNSYQKVIKPMVNKANKLYKIDTMCSETLYVTEEHPFYVRKKYKELDKEKGVYYRKFEEPQWIKAKDLNKNCYVGIAINQESKLPNWNGITCNINQSKSIIKNELKNFFKYDEFWWLVGRYIGDGWTTITKRKDRNNSYLYKTILCCNKKELNEITDVLDKLNKKTNNYFSYSINEERTVYKICISKQELVEYLNTFGKYAYGKHITNDIFDLPIDLLKNFIQGYNSADGCYTQNLNSITSTSQELIYGIGECIAKAYNRPYSIYKVKRPKQCTIEGRIVNQRDSYLIKWKNENKKQDKAFYDGKYIWYPINKIEKIDYDGLVYNMEVENDNSYTVNNIIVHNCQNISIMRKTAVDSRIPEGLNGEESKLFFDYVRILNDKLPKYFIFENVRNLLSSNNGEDFKTVVDLLGKNYNIHHQLMNSCDYGIPQVRRRLFIVGKRKDLGEFKYEFPKPIELTMTVQDLLEPIVDDKYYLTDKMYKTVMSTGTKGWYAKPETDCKIAKPLVRTMHKMHRASTDNYYHTEYKPQGKTNLRRLTPLECFRLQGFSDEDYKKVSDIKISDTQMYMQTGNSITVKVLEYIFKNLFIS